MYGAIMTAGAVRCFTLVSLPAEPRGYKKLGLKTLARKRSKLHKAGFYLIAVTSRGTFRLVPSSSLSFSRVTMGDTSTSSRLTALSLSYSDDTLVCTVHWAFSLVGLPHNPGTDFIGKPLTTRRPEIELHHVLYSCL